MGQPEILEYGVHVGARQRHEASAIVHLRQQGLVDVDAPRLEAVCGGRHVQSPHAVRHFTDGFDNFNPVCF